MTMIEIGRINRLKVTEKRGKNIHLDGGSLGDIPLTDRYPGAGYRPGDALDVFILVDKEQRVVATTRKPYAQVGDFAALRVVATGAAGAFLDWGLDSDLLVPRSEQQENMREGQTHVVYIVLNKDNKRIIASAKLSKFLGLQPPAYAEEEEVEILVYAETALGYSAVVNNTAAGMIYRNEVFQDLAIGQRLEGFVKKVREDGKLDLRLQPAGYQIIDGIAQVVLDTLKKSGGSVAVTDKSPPEEVYALFGVSKKVFKKAIGALYKKRLIVIDKTTIRLAD